MQATSFATRPAVSARPARQALTVRAAAKPQEQKVNRVAQVALAGLAAVYMVAAPAAQAATVKQVLCASNPTSKLCLRDSAVAKASSESGVAARK